MGPWIVTADEIDDPQSLQVRLWVDGDLRHDYNMDDMAYPIARLIEWASTINTLEPGDVVSCGVNHQGLGPIQEGETAVMEIEEVGRLSIHVRDPHKRKWPKGIDHEMAAWVKQSLAVKGLHSLRSSGDARDTYHNDEESLTAVLVEVAPPWQVLRS
jgi:Fumarylacetoacetate (FAA) hydrolase family